MKKNKKYNIDSPSHRVRNRLLKNKPAMFGLVIIIIAHIISLLGYLIMPDDTPNADDGSAHIKKQPPGFRVLILKTIKNRDVPKVNIIQKIFFGQESEYKIEPISEYDIKGNTVYYKIFGKPDRLSQPLITTVKKVYNGTSLKLNPDSATGLNFNIKGNVITYLDLDENLQTITLEDLQKEFLEKNLEWRTYWLGTSKEGRDLLSMLLFGTKISLSIGFISVLISVVVGVTVGALAGFFGGWIDNVLMWFMTVIWSIPGIMLVIAISLALQSRGIWVAFVAVGLTMWVEVARVVRGQIMSIKEKLYVEAAKALGIGNMRIIFVHILPNVIGSIIVIATSNFASAILIEAGLSFLGLGVKPPMPSWGKMVYDGYMSNWESGGAYLVFFPSLCICLLVYAFNLFGNGLRDAYDPQKATKW
ncbi:MAG: ABC transporter permease [Cytophagaceae bacterium]|nr:ABC transporter permease [Cytophagaceae bacterium]MDW8456375.1 ABC transporter permease [Cytophagaceae bacterium]